MSAPASPMNDPRGPSLFAPASRVDAALERRVPLLLLGRLAVATFFLGLIIITQVQTGQDVDLRPHYLLAAVVYALSGAYALGLRYLRASRLVVYVQLGGDIVLVTLLVYLTGGVSSLFPFMYSIVILAASILLYLPGGLWAASLSSAGYGGLITLQYLQVFDPIMPGVLSAGGFAGAPLYFPLAVHVSSFYLVALLGSFVAEHARRSQQALDRQQTDLDALEALHEHVFRCIPSGLMILDLQRRIVNANPAAQDILDISFAEMYGQQVTEVIPGIEAVVQTRDRSATRMEVSLEREPDHALVLGFSLTPLQDQQHALIGYILVFQDLTTVRQMQDALQRMDRQAALGRMAAGIAHEVRNPLASISGSIQVLRRGLRLSDADCRLMDIVVRESDGLSRLIDDFTQYVRSTPTTRTRVVLRDLADEVISMLRNSPEVPAGATLALRPSSAAAVEGCAQSLRQVLWNLLRNGLQALGPDGGSVSIEVSSGVTCPLAGDAWRGACLRVRDTGCGMEETARIFDPFYSTKEQGTGLGLAVVYRIVQDHGGYIAVESVRGRGTTFSLFLPEIAPAS